MSQFHEWKSISKAQVENLETVQDHQSVKGLLAQYLGLRLKDNTKNTILTDFHYYNYAFCKENAFDGRRTSTFMSIMNDVFLRDAGTSSRKNTAVESCEYFKALMMKHSVNRPPRNIQVFTPLETEKIFDFVSESYYRHFRLYKYVFCDKIRLLVQQIEIEEIETPAPQLSSLALGVYKDFPREVEAAIEEISKDDAVEHAH